MAVKQPLPCQKRQPAAIILHNLLSLRQTVTGPGTATFCEGIGRRDRRQPQFSVGSWPVIEFKAGTGGGLAAAIGPPLMAYLPFGVPV